jgi:hypothetical protein
MENLGLWVFALAILLICMLSGNLEDIFRLRNQLLCNCVFAEATCFVTGFFDQVFHIAPAPRCGLHFVVSLLLSHLSFSSSQPGRFRAH